MAISPIQYIMKSPKVNKIERQIDEKLEPFVYKYGDCLPMFDIYTPYLSEMLCEELIGKYIDVGWMAIAVRRDNKNKKCHFVFFTPYNFKEWHRNDIENSNEYRIYYDTRRSNEFENVIII